MKQMVINSLVLNNTKTVHIIIIKIIKSIKGYNTVAHIHFLIIFIYRPFILYA